MFAAAQTKPALQSNVIHGIVVQPADAIPTRAEDGASGFINGNFMYSYSMADWSLGRSYLRNALKDLFGGHLGYVPLPEEGEKSIPQPKSDAQVVRDIKVALAAEPSVRASAIDVCVKDGAMTLTGAIDGDGERWLIENVARRIAGVKSLSMKLKVVVPEPGMRTDDDIAHSCEDVLVALIPQCDYAIRVLVSNGRVTLMGDVAWGYERWIAETMICDLAGVLGVNSQVKVRPTVIRDDVDAIIEAAMKRKEIGEAPYH